MLQGDTLEEVRSCGILRYIAVNCLKKVIFATAYTLGMI